MLLFKRRLKSENVTPWDAYGKYRQTKTPSSSTDFRLIQKVLCVAVLHLVGVLLTGFTNAINFHAMACNVKSDVFRC
jgi:hypothetical protein